MEQLIQEQVESRLNTILNDVGDVPISISRDSRLSDFGMDSLDILDMVIEIEDEFDINIENAHDIKTYGELVDIIKLKVY